MSTLIAYATKHGFTEKCAQALAKKLGENTDLCNLSKNKPDLSKYDKVIIGGSIYVGMMRKSVKRFCSDNLNILKSKKLGFFTCGMIDAKEAQTQINTSFPQELLSVAVAKEHFGGEFCFRKMNLIERAMIKRVSGSNKDICVILEENIDRFAQLMINA